VIERSGFDFSARSAADVPFGLSIMLRKRPLIWPIWVATMGTACIGLFSFSPMRKCEYNSSASYLGDVNGEGETKDWHEQKDISIGYFKGFFEC